MKLESLQCNNCGADIEVSSETRFATCAHCGSKLAVVRTASAAYTELADKVAELSGQVRDQIERAGRHAALEDLEREWNREREQYMITSRYGVRHIPTRTAATFARTWNTVLGVVFVFIALLIAGILGGVIAAVGAPGPFMLLPFIFPAFGMILIGLSIRQSRSAYNHALRYEQAEAAYQQRRQALLAESDT